MRWLPNPLVTVQPTRLLYRCFSSYSSGTSKKRPASEVGTVAGGSSSKIVKLHPFFAKPATDDVSAPFHWQSPLGPKQTCLYATNHSPGLSTKVAAFDLDGTIIEGNVKNNTTEWKWWRSCVKSKLEEVVEQGYAVVIISNQGIKPERLKVWKEKVRLIAGALPNVPFRLFAATAKDGFRKPMPGMWTELERMFGEASVRIDKKASFFVGDAAGRKGDFAGTDRKWALNVGIKFYTPEEYFLGLPVAPYQLVGFNVSSLPSNLPLFTPTSSPLIPNSSDSHSKSKSKSAQQYQEIILFVGYPGVGKSSFYRRHLEPAGYVHVNQDILGSKPKCVKKVEEILGEGKSCVVDNTNRDQPTRKTYITLANKHKVKIRCFHFTAPMELAWHNNMYRAYALPPSAAAREPSRAALPYLAFTGYRSAFEEPDMEEGFDEIKKINFIWEGSEEERKCWEMWLQVDGK